MPPSAVRFSSRAARAALDVYAAPGFHQRLFEVSEHFRIGFEQHIASSGAIVRFQQLGPRFGLYFGVDTPVTNYRQAAQRDLAAEMVFIRSCFEQGVFLQPSAHHGFSAVHTISDIDFALDAMGQALGVVRDWQQRRK